MNPLVIVGAGHAGCTLLREFRRHDSETPVLLLSRDAAAQYYKPNLSKALALGKTAAALVQADAAALAAQFNAEVRAHSTVSAIDPAAHTLRVGDDTIQYSRLVLATGAAPLQLPPLAGHALSVNHLDDYAELRARLAPGAPLLIVGAGLIGCEFANDFAAAGHPVDLLDIADWPLARLLPQAQGEALRDALAAIGVRFHPRARIEAVTDGDGGKTVQLESGERLRAACIVSAVGLRPVLALAREAGLACNLGIRVDARMQTSAADIYALGDCVEIGGRLLPYVLPIAHAARALAQTLAGTPTAAEFPAMPVLVKTPACPTVICPPPDADGAWTLSGSGQDLAAVFVNAAGHETGYALTGAAVARRGELTARMPAMGTAG